MIFCTDLDNTLIYSGRHEIGAEKICVEYYQGREASYMTKRSLALLEKLRGGKLKNRLRIVPVTTRTVEQYQRIHIGDAPFEYALTCNGGLLLCNGETDRAWLRESKELVADMREEVVRGIRLLEKDENRIMEIRDIEELFVFTKSSEPEETIRRMGEQLDLSKVGLFQNGVKVYIVPKGLDKGTGIKRLAKKLREDEIFAAGDSNFDIPMLKVADYSFLPEKLAKAWKDSENLKIPENSETMHIVGENRIFSDEILKILCEIT